MKLEILREAEDELIEAVEYYEVMEAGLGVRLRQEAERCLVWICEHPLLAHPRRNGYRRVNLRAFPYYAAYAIRGEIVWVLAIGHASRKPEYWSQRMKGL